MSFKKWSEAHAAPNKAGTDNNLKAAPVAAKPLAPLEKAPLKLVEATKS